MRDPLRGASPAERRARLRERIDSGDTLVAPGCHDAISALLAQQVGFEAVYVSGFAAEGATLGRPDIGFMDRTDYLRVGSAIAAAVDVPAICDVEQGFGTAIHVGETVRLFEAGGLAGIHLDDEVPPGKCPFIPGAPPASLVSINEMQGRIRRAVECRTDPDFLIIARCDMATTLTGSEDVTVSGEAFERYVERLVAYADAGADLAFIMPQSPEHLEILTREISIPTLAVLNPWLHLSVDDLRAAGVSIVITTMSSLFVAARAMREALERLRDHGTVDSFRDLMIDPADYWELVGVPSFTRMYGDYEIGGQQS